MQTSRHKKQSHLIHTQVVSKSQSYSHTSGYSSSLFNSLSSTFLHMRDSTKDLRSLIYAFSLLFVSLLILSFVVLFSMQSAYAAYTTQNEFSLQSGQSSQPTHTVYNEFDLSYQTQQNEIQAQQVQAQQIQIPSQNEFTIVEQQVTEYVYVTPQTTSAPSQIVVQNQAQTVSAREANQPVVQNEFVFVANEPTIIERVEYVQVPTPVIETRQAQIPQVITKDIIDVVGGESITVISPEVYEPTPLPFSVNLIDKPLTVYACQSYSETIVVRNDASVATQFSVVVSNPRISSWFSVSPNQFVLASGEMRAVNISFTIPCGESVVTSYDVRVSNAQYAQTYSRQFTVLETSNVFLAVDENEFSMCPQTREVIPFVLVNNGFEAESYRLSVSFFDRKYVNVSSEYVVLEPGQSYYGNVSIQYLKPGKEKFTLYAKTQKSQLTAKIPFIVQVDDCASYIASFDTTQKTMCALSYGGSVLEIYNNGTRTNTYTLSLNRDAKSVTDLSAKSVTIAPGERGIVTASFDPIYVGSTPIEVTVRDKLTRSKQKVSLELNATYCYDATIQYADAAVNSDIQNYSTIVASNGFSNPISFCPEPHIIFVNVTNIAPYEATYQLSLQTQEENQTQGLGSSSASGSLTSDSVSLLASSVTLQSGASALIGMSLDFRNLESSEYRGTFVARILDTQYVSTMPLRYDVASLDSCYGVTVSPTYHVVLYGTEVHNITVTNVGSKPTTYDVSVLGAPTWAYITQSSITLNSGESEDLKLVTMADDVRNTSYPFTLVLDSQYYSQTSQQELDVNPNNDAIIMLFVLLGIIIGFVLLLLLFPSLLMLLLIGLIGFGLFVLYPFVIPSDSTDMFSNDTQNGTVGATYTESLANVSEFLKVNKNKVFFVPINGTRTIYYSGMFSDPDNDNLTYSMIGNFSKISVTVVDDEIIITPEKDFIGYESFYVIADDGQIATQSPLLYIVVTSEEMIAQYNRRVLTQTIIVLCVILVILLIIFLISDARSKGRDKEGSSASKQQSVSKNAARTKVQSSQKATKVVKRR
jgi:hypothetical protein